MNHPAENVKKIISYKFSLLRLNPCFPREASFQPPSLITDASLTETSVHVKEKDHLGFLALVFNTVYLYVIFFAPAPPSAEA